MRSVVPAPIFRRKPASGCPERIRSSCDVELFLIQRNRNPGCADVRKAGLVQITDGGLFVGFQTFTARRGSGLLFGTLFQDGFHGLQALLAIQKCKALQFGTPYGLLDEAFLLLDGTVDATSQVRVMLNKLFLERTEIKIETDDGDLNFVFPKDYSDRKSVV